MSIIDILSKWLIEQGFSTILLATDTDTCYAIYEDCIYLNPNEEDTTDEWKKFVTELGGYQVDIPLFLQAFFHELGHAETMPFMTDEELANSAFLKECIYLNESDNPYYYYYRVPVEKIATEWSINFVNDNTDAVVALWERIKEALL